MPDQQIKVGDIVYQRKLGWSGVPMEVVELTSLTAVCKGAYGWGLNGLLSSKHRARINEYLLTILTHVPNSAT